MTAYYNEIDPYAAQWLRNLIAAGHLAKGEVDERSITEVQYEDLLDFDQCHFFAGIGVWGYALRQAGWADDRPVWTGSCPCQPFSSAGKQEGFADERHLWPAWFKLIRKCRPPVIVGEQVASALDWLDLVSTDLEDADYAFGASDLCAAGFGGAHIRQRLYFTGVANTISSRRQRTGWSSSAQSIGVAERSGVSRLANAPLDGRRQGVKDGGRLRSGNREEGTAGRSAINSDLSGGLADTESGGDIRQRKSGLFSERVNYGQDGGLADRGRSCSADGFWRDADWLFCRDGKWRPVRPGTFPLAHGAPARVGRLRAYGNALDAQTATQFVAAVMDCAP
jgi:DNA (cytosine-5)-methyltransferase 1